MEDRIAATIAAVSSIVGAFGDEYPEILRLSLNSTVKNIAHDS
jgi:hypothetical protein